MNTETDVPLNPTEWLRRILIDGAAESAHLKAHAAKRGIGPKALRNARERLGVVVTRRGNGEAMRSVWTLPVAGSWRGGRPDVRAIRAPTKPVALLSSANAFLLRNVDIGGGITEPSQPTPMLGLVRNRASSADGELSSSVKVAAVQPEHDADHLLTRTDHALTPPEQARALRRVQLFVQRGMNEADARELAVRLAVGRDRTNGRALGSCVECQAFVRNACAVVRPTSVIHECWRRRHDAP